MSKKNPHNHTGSPTRPRSPLPSVIRLDNLTNQPAPSDVHSLRNRIEQLETKVNQLETKMKSKRKRIRRKSCDVEKKYMVTLILESANFAIDTTAPSYPSTST